MIWKEIPGTNGFYRVNELGEVQSCKTPGNTKTGSVAWHTIRPALGKQRKHLHCILYLGYDSSGKYIVKTRNVHKLVWAAFVGKIPEGFVLDHVNRDPINNCLSNLRLATRSQNMGNRRKGFVRNGRVTHSKYLGVTRNTRRSSWQAQITIKGQVKYLGSYKTEEQAAAAYNQAALDYFGEFASPNVIC